MRLVIMGCGRLGSALAADMAEGGHAVTIMDLNPDAFRRLPAHFRGTAIVGNGIDEDALRRAQIEATDIFIAATQGDNRNLMAAQIAKHIFQVPRVISRVYDRQRAELYKELGVETISPTQAISEIVERMIAAGPLRVTEEAD